MFDLLNHLAWTLGWILMVCGAFFLCSLLCFLMVNTAWKRLIDVNAFMRVLKECNKKGENPWKHPFKGKK